MTLPAFVISPTFKTYHWSLSSATLEKGKETLTKTKIPAGVPGSVVML